MKHQLKYALLAAALLPQMGSAQELSADVRQKIGELLDSYARKEIAVGRVKIDSVAVEGKTLQLFANMNWAYYPFREDNVTEIYRSVANLLPKEFARHQVQIWTNKHCIEDFVPQALRSKKDKKAKTFSPKVTKPLVTNMSAPHIATLGLQNKHT